MIGRNAGWLHTPGESLSDKFAENGFPVISVSAFPNRYMRFADIARTLVQCRNQIDIMVLQVYGERSFVVEDVASWLGKRFRHRIVMFLHGGTLPDFFQRFPNWARRVLARADALVTPSPFLARTVKAYGFCAQVIPNPLDISIYPYRHRSKARPRMFWMRAFHRWYNPFMAIRVLARLKTKYEDATLTMAGQDKGIEVTVKELAKKLGVDNAVRFAGFLDVKNKLREGEAADIFLNTNHVDNTPVSILEACAMGLPVVATRVGGIPDLLVDGETGLLVADDDYDAMARAVCRILQEPALSARLSANGRRFAESCSWEQVYPLWERLLADVLSGRSSTQPESLMSLSPVSAVEPRRSSFRGR
jgi:glycosyltransferase involved in cell wall biosynthesis